MPHSHYLRPKLPGSLYISLVLPFSRSSSVSLSLLRLVDLFLQLQTYLIVSCSIGLHERFQFESIVTSYALFLITPEPLVCLSDRVSSVWSFRIVARWPSLVVSVCFLRSHSQPGVYLLIRSSLYGSTLYTCMDD